MRNSKNPEIDGCGKARRLISEKKLEIKKLTITEARKKEDEIQP